MTQPPRFQNEANLDDTIDPTMERSLPPPIRGRGASVNPANRFAAIDIEPDLDQLPGEESPGPTTKYYRDFTRTIIAHNESPDVGFESSINPYRGCEHGCIYCYARPTHEYLGFSAGLDFESRIMVKEEAPELLAKELSAPNWKPQVLVMSGVTDPYQPIERRLQLTRRCLEVSSAVSQSGCDHHQESARDPRHRFVRRIGRAPGRRGQYFRHVARSETATRPRTAHFHAARAAGGDCASCALPASRLG